MKELSWSWGTVGGIIIDIVEVWGGVATTKLDWTWEIGGIVINIEGVVSTTDSTLASDELQRKERQGGIAS